MFNSFGFFPQNVYNKNVLVKLLSAKHTFFPVNGTLRHGFSRGKDDRNALITYVIITISVNFESFIRANIIKHCSAT